MTFDHFGSTPPPQTRAITEILSFLRDLERRGHESSLTIACNLPEPLAKGYINAMPVSSLI
jgi:hypothetical protein